MHRRSLMLMTVLVIMTTACGSISVDETAQPTATVILPATETSIPTIQSATVEPATPTATSQPAMATDWLSQLEVIRAGNWSRLQLLKTFLVEMPLGSAMAISPDGRTLAVGRQKGASIFFFDIVTGQLVRTIPIALSDVGEYFTILSMEYLPDETLMVSSSGPYATYHMDSDGNILATWDGNTYALSSDKSILAHMDENGLTLVDMVNNTPLLSLDNSDALSLAFSPDGSRIAAENVGVDYIRTVVWDIPNNTILSTLEETAIPRYSPDGKFLAAIYYDHQNDRTPLKIFSPDGVTELVSLNVSEPNDLVNSPVVWSMDGSVIAAQVSDGSSFAWDTSTWQPLETRVIQGQVYSLSPDGRILITRTSDGSILLWGVLP